MALIIINSILTQVLPHQLNWPNFAWLLTLPVTTPRNFVHNSLKKKNSEKSNLPCDTLSPYPTFWKQGPYSYFCGGCARRTGRTRSQEGVVWWGDPTADRRSNSSSSEATERSISDESWQITAIHSALWCHSAHISPIEPYCTIYLVVIYP